MVAETLNDVLELLRRRQDEPLPMFERDKSTAEVVREILEYLRVLKDEPVPKDVMEDEADDRGALLDAVRAGDGLISHRTPDALVIAVARKPEEAVLLPENADLFRVKVTKDGGIAGDEDNNCTWTYTVTSLAGDELGTTRTPEKPRYDECAYEQPGADSPGLAYWDSDSVLHLYEALEEIPDSTECP